MMKVVLFAFVLNTQVVEVTDIIPPQPFDTYTECSEALEKIIPVVKEWRRPGSDAGAFCEPVNEEDIQMVHEQVHEDIRNLMNPFRGRFLR